MSGGSLEMRKFRIALRDGCSPEDAANEAGVSLTEALLTIKDDARNPPPPEAFILFDHNSKEPAPMSEPNIAADPLRLFIERIERLEEEKKGIADDIRDVYAEAKSTGYDAKTMRKVVRLRAMEKHDRDEAATLLQTYCDALGIQGGFAF